jgi:hypothetical protein
MANTIAYAAKFVPIIDGLYKLGSYTGGMDSKTQIDFTGVAEVKILKITTVGLGNYSRTDGYPKGNVTVAWETITLEQERGIEISIDRMDNEETLGTAFGEVTSQYMTLQVNPELDAYRFAKYAGTSGVTVVEADLTKDTIIAAIDAAVMKQNVDEVPTVNKVLYLNTNLQTAFSLAVSRIYAGETAISNVVNSYNGIPIVYVVPSRFYDKITLKDGATEFGYVPAADAVEINFMLVYTPCLMQAVKFALPKIFTPDENQDKDMWKFQLRIYHDAFIYDNKVAGVYVHKKSTAVSI